MRVTRLVSKDEWSNLQLSAKTLRLLQTLVWRDPVTDSQLEAMSHERKICPLIRLWRQRFDQGQF